MERDSSLFQTQTSDGNATLLMLGNASAIFASPNPRRNHSDEFQASGYIEATRLANRSYHVPPHHMCLLRAASNHQSAGFQKIIPWQPTYQREYIPADGVIIEEPGVMAMFQTADCPSVFVWDREHRRGIFYHCGRPAGEPNDGQNIITQALQWIAPQDNLSALEVLILGTICGRCFPNCEGQARLEAESYLDNYGPEVFVDVETRSLDMRKVIELTHLAAGLEPAQITFFGPDCTKETQHCASHRQHLMHETIRQHANTVMVVT